MSDTKYDVIIIGSGVGGLTAGLTMQTLKPEMKTLILEQHYAPGGYISGFKREGYYFDSGAEGLVLCGENQNFRKSIEGLGVNLDLISVNPLEVFQFHDKTVTMYADPVQYEEELSQKYPENAEEIKKLFKVLKQIRDDYNSNVKEGLNPSFKEYIKIGLTCPTMRKYAFMSFKDFLDKFISNEQLKKVLSAYCLWLGMPSDSLQAVSVAMTFFSPVFDGYHYPKGG
ncbi:MAG: phytoene desaturase family protein, partial [Candidatus Heimdallarchaeaceae archaeon]